MAEADEWRKRAREWFARAQTSGDKFAIDLFSALANESMLLADDIEANRVAPLTRGHRDVDGQAHIPGAPVWGLLSSTNRAAS
jgi:hypothetical protein